MATTSTNTTITHNSSATLQAWATEIFTALVTTLGLTQTADTGQTATSALVYNATLNSVAGFIILEFNDTLNATSPLFIKLEFGTGSAATAPQMLITIGNGTNGAGTLTGLVSTRVAAFNGSAPASNVVNYTSRFCYNTTQGFLGMVFKIGGGAGSVATNSVGGFFLWRTVDNTGAPTATAVNLLTNSNSTVGSTANGGCFQSLNYSLSTTTISNNASCTWVFVPLNFLSTVQGTNGQIFPGFQYGPGASAPGLGITNAFGACVEAEIALHATVTVTVLGSLSLTYIMVGNALGNNSLSGQGYAAATYGALMLWT